VFVSLGGVTTALAGEHRLGDAVLSCSVAAVFAAVGGVARVDLYPDTPSVFRFGAQNRDQLAPASVTDASVEPRLRSGSVGQKLPAIGGVRYWVSPPQHVGDLQILHCQQVVMRYELAGLLVMEVLPLVGHFTMPGSHSFPLCCPVLRATYGASQPLLSCAQACTGLSSPARISDMLTVTGGGETDDAEIDTGLATGRR
jgi:hypothetical protein